MQAAKRVIKNTGILYARMAITVFISLYSTRLILTALGVNDFGIFNLVGGAITMLMFLNNAMTGATQRFMSFAEGEGNSEKQKYIFNVSLVLHLLTAILAVLLLEIVGYFLFDYILKIPITRMEAAKFIFHFLVINTFFTIVSVPYDAVINAHENMLLVAILGIAETFIKLGIAIYISYVSSDKLIIYGFLIALLSVLLLVIRQIYCHYKYKEVIINIRKYFNKSLFKEMTFFAGWSLFGCSSSMIGSYGQGILLNMFFGTAVNAAQGISIQINGQLGAFASTMLKALNPMISKSEGAGNRELMLEAAMRGSKISFFLLMFFVIPAFIEMPFIFKLWLKNIPEFAIVFCRLFLIKSLIDQIFITLISIIAAVGNIRKYEVIVSVLYILPLILSFFAFQFGLPPYFLYIITIFFSIITGVFNVYYSKVYCDLPVSFFYRQIVLPSVLVLLGVFASSIIPFLFLPEGLVRLILVVLISIGTFFPIVWFVGLTSSEKTNISLMLKNVLKKMSLIK
ncbi:MAG: hypothetical protein J7574_08360 [Flavobacterium sp.]|uniref:hypothetical protein n=1 Tax=Flavobacterium sp. TaxID=239 RepID=UPI001AFFE9AB|nr:hypothetical protein [Flavobacterium sp.]MBO9584157.1 hypothetical protein [Flavobacterium sp.]